MCVEMWLCIVLNERGKEWVCGGAEWVRVMGVDGNVGWEVGGGRMGSEDVVCLGWWYLVGVDLFEKKERKLCFFSKNKIQRIFKILV